MMKRRTLAIVALLAAIASQASAVTLDIPKQVGEHQMVRASVPEEYTQHQWFVVPEDWAAQPDIFYCQNVLVFCGPPGRYRIWYVGRNAKDANESAQAYVEIGGEPPAPDDNKPPVAAADAYATPAGEPLTVDAPGLLGNDYDPEDKPLTVADSTAPAHGTASVAKDGGFVYTPAVGFSGTDTFRYRATDGVSRSSEATVTITVEAPGPDVPEGTLGLTRLAYNEASKVPAASRGKAAELANNFQAVSSAIAAGAYRTVADANDDLKQRNQTVVGAAGREDWLPMFTILGTRFAGLRQSGDLVTLDDHAAAYKAVGDGLRLVK